MSFKSKFFTILGDIRLYRWPLWISYMPNDYDLDAKAYRKISKVLKVGDILLRKYHTYLDRFVIPGYWDHVALYVGKNQVIHAVSEGVQRIDLIDFCKCDELLILRPMLNKNQVKKGCLRAKAMVGKEYDFDLDFKNHKKVVCTELIYRAYRELLGIKPHKNLWFSNRKFLIPDDLVQARVLLVRWDE